MAQMLPLIEMEKAAEVAQVSLSSNPGRGLPVTGRHHALHPLVVQSPSRRDL